MTVRVADWNATFDTYDDYQAVANKLKEERENYERACILVADMHAAAVGEVRGPTVGPVEDVAALRAALLGVEWSATGAVSGVGCCPECGGYDPAQATNGNTSWHAGYHGNRAGHSTECGLANALSGGKP